jgi:hypothetical protein
MATLRLIIFVGTTILILYQIVAYIYFLIAVYKLSSTTRKITKMPGLSFFFVVFHLYSLILFYPTTISYFSFISSVTSTNEVGHITGNDRAFLEHGSVGHIIVSIVVMLMWVTIFLMQIVTSALTMEISTQRLVPWSSVEPYSRIAFMLIKVYQAFMLTVVVSDSLFLLP